MEGILKNRRKIVGLTIALLMVMSLAIPMLTTVAPMPVQEETFAVINSAGSGNWNAGGTWVGGTPPDTNDDAVILNTHTVTLTANQLTGSCEIQSGGTLAGGGYTLTCNDENGAGFSFDHDGTISGVLDLTFNYTGASNVDMVGTLGNVADVILDDAGLNITQTTTTIISTLTVTNGVWDCNDQDLTISGAVDVDDELVGGSGTIRIGGNTDLTGATFSYETSTVRMTNSLSLTQDSAYFWDWYLDDSVVVTLTAPAIAMNTLTIDGTTAGGFTGAQSVYVSFGTAPAQVIFAGANADFGNCPLLIMSSDDTDTKIDGCTYNDIDMTIGGDAVVRLANRSMTCVDMTMNADGFGSIKFDTMTYDFHSTGAVSFTDGDANANEIFDAQSNDIIFAGATTFGGWARLYSDSANVYIVDDFTLTAPASMGWNNSNTIINGTAEQTITGVGAFPFHNLTVNNSHATETVIFASNVDVDGNLTFTDGQVDMATNNVDFNTALNVTISNTTTFTFGGGTWEFDGDTNFTDNNANATNIDDVIVTGTLFVLSDIAIENLTVNTTGFLDLTADEWLTLYGDAVINTTADFNRGNTVWECNGTTNQTITMNGHPLFRINNRNTDGILTFSNDTNMTWMKLFANTTTVLSDDMTVSRFYTDGSANARVNVSSNDSTERSLFNPIGQRFVDDDYTDFNDVTLVPAETVDASQSGAPSPTPPPLPPPPIEEEPPSEEGGGCGSAYILVGVAFFGGGFAIFKRLRDPRRKED